MSVESTVWMGKIRLPDQKRGLMSGIDIFLFYGESSGCIVKISRIHFGTVAGKNSDLQSMP